MTFRIVKQVTVAAPVEQVWQWMMEDETEWRKPFVTNVEKVADGTGEHGEIGAEYRNTALFLLVPTYPVNRVTVYDPPHRVTWDTISGGGLIGQKNSSYILEPLNGGTRVTFDFTYDGVLARMPFRPMTKLSVDGVLSIMQRRIKKGVEEAR